MPDHKGSAHLILNESGDVIEENLFSPFAEPLQGVNVNKFSYEAKEYDNTVKDYDFHFRKYQPGIGFTQPDTLIQNVYDPQSLNRYSFERNNPLKNKDENGHYVVVAYYALLTYAWGDSVGYGLLSLGYIYLSIANSDSSYSSTLSDRLENSLTNVAAGLSPISPKGWISLPGDTKQFFEDLSVVNGQKSTESQSTSSDLKCTILLCPQILPNPITGQQTPMPNPTQQANSAQTVTPNNQVSQNIRNENAWITDYNTRYSRYSVNDPSRPADINNGKVNLGYGGSYGGFECYVESCSATEAYYKE